MAFTRLLGNKPSITTRIKAESILQQLVRDGRIPGLAIEVNKGEELYFQKGFGFADIDKKIPVDPVKTVFRAASASKPIAATGLAKMWLAGIIDLDTSFYHYVPYFPKKKFDFSIRQLAAHTAGIRSYRGKEYALNRPLSIRDSISIFKDDPLLFPPGSSYHYNSFDWVLISLAMQEASGIPFEAYIRDEVLLPIGMKNTTAEIPGEKISKKAEFYTKIRGGFRKAAPVDNRYKLAGGGYLTTASDLALLGKAYLTGKFIEPDIVEEFLAPHTINGRSTFYGLGWEVSQNKMGQRFFGHTGNSVGGYSNFYVFPDQEAVVSILINCTDPKIQPILDELISIIMEGDS